MISSILFILALPVIITLVLICVSFFKNGDSSQNRWWRMQMLVAYDQLVNAYFKGWSDETMSSRSWRKSVSGDDWQRSIIDKIFFWDKDHCHRSYTIEQQRGQLPPELRGE
jgi:hypothetical protein